MPDGRGYMDEWDGYYKVRPDVADRIKENVAQVGPIVVDDKVRRSVVTFVADVERKILKEVFGGESLCILERPAYSGVPME